MKYTMLPCLFAFVGCLYLSFTMADNVLDLTDSDFSSNIAQYDTVLAMFYAPWCGHCKKLKPEFEKAASILKSSDSSIVLAKVDCTEGGKQTCQDFQVQGYPTLKIFSKGELLKEYNGPREANGIVKYMQSQAGPSSKELVTLLEFDNFITKDEPVVVGFFPAESDLKGTFLQLANKLREKVTFGHTASAEIQDKEGVKGEQIRLYRPKLLSNKFEESVVSYPGSEQVSEMESWVKESYHGLVGVRTRENSAEFNTPLVIAYYNVDFVKNPKGTNYWRNRILKVAKGYSGEYKFAISSKDEFQNELNEFGVDYVSSDKPVVFAKGQQKLKYAMKDEFSVENLQTFLNDLENGNLVPYVKSEEIPEDNSGPVITAVAKNFKEAVLENGKDTLIEFYAPWCGHCKKLTPIYEKLATKLKDEDVAIVKMDATANDVPPSFDVRGFPTLFWLPKDKKEKPIPYEGGRELKDFIKYIAENASKELKNYDRFGKPKNKEKDEL